MVVKTAVLVVDDDKERLLPFRAGDQSLYQFADERLAVAEV
jgi:hypothetical protein